MTQCYLGPAPKQRVCEGHSYLGLTVLRKRTKSLTWPNSDIAPITLKGCERNLVLNLCFAFLRRDKLDLPKPLFFVRTSSLQKRHFIFNFSVVSI